MSFAEIFDHCSKQYNWYDKCFPKRLSYTKNPEYFEDSSSFPWNPPIIICSDLIETIPQISPPFTTRTVLWAIPFVSDLCGVEVQ